MNSHIVALALTLLAVVPFVAPPQSMSLAGTWKATEVTLTGPGAGTFTNVSSLTLLTARYFARVEVRTDAPRPMVTDPANATADEMRAAWGPFFAEAGTYEISGGELTMRPIVSKNSAAMNGSAYTVYAVTLSGNVLTLTSKRNQAGPLPNPVTIKATRIE
jgi:hypothetical protein